MKLELTQAQALVLMAFFGFLLVAFGAWFLLRRRSTMIKLTRLTMPVTARVTDVLTEERTEWKESGDGKTLARTRIIYTPVLEYEVGGKTYKQAHSVHGSAPRVNAGSSIRILCNPENPSEARYQTA